MLKNNVVVVTGGAGLVGRGLVQAIIKEGGIAVIADIDTGSAESVKSQLSDKSIVGEVDFVNLDISSKQSLVDCVRHLDKKYGRIDALVNNAYPRNRNYGRHFFEVEYDDFVENVGLNLGGYFLTSQHFAKYFFKQGYGNIVNISSIYGIIAPRFEIYDKTSMTMPVEYAAIKSALISLTKYMAKYFKGKNIRVNALSPGGIYDNQPASFLEAYRQKCLNKGMLDMGDLGGTLIYLLSDMSRYVNGQNIVVDDGFAL